MLKNSPILLASGVVAALLLSGCHKDDAGSADSAPPPMPARPAKPNAGVPGMGAKPGAPDAGKGAQVAGGKAAPGKTDPFAPKGGNKAGDKMQAKGKAGADKGKLAGAKGAGTGTPAAATSTTPALPGALGSPGATAGAPPAPGTPGAPAKPGAPGAPGTKIAAVPKQREYDPFKVTWHQVPPPPYVFGSVQPLRLASAEVETPVPGDVNVREVANRRVSGIMSGDGVFAILEGADGAEPDIVKPGSVTKDGYRVVSINADSVKLQRKDGNVIRTQVVPLTDASTVQQGNGSGLFGNRGGGFPGSAGAGGFPGSSGGPGGSGGAGGKRLPGGRGPGGGGRLGPVD